MKNHPYFGEQKALCRYIRKAILTKSGETIINGLASLVNDLGNRLFDAECDGIDGAFTLAQKQKKITKVGLFVSWLDETSNKVFIGWSLCKQGDVFTKEDAYSIAISRAKEIENLSIDALNVPNSIQYHFAWFIDKCINKYGENVIYPPWLSQDIFETG